MYIFCFIRARIKSGYVIARSHINRTNFPKTVKHPARLDARILYTTLLLASIPCWAQGSASSDQDGWFARVSRAQAAQPRWITPVVTVTPRLEEEFTIRFPFA